MKMNLKKIAGFLSIISWLIVLVVVMFYELPPIAVVTLIAWTILYISKNLLDVSRMKGSEATIKIIKEMKK